MANLDWVAALEPTGTPHLERLSEHSDLHVWHVNVSFQQWEVPPELAARWTDKHIDERATWHKRPLVRTAAEIPYSCGEVELAVRLRRAGFEAYWVSEWNGFAHVTHWEPYCIKRSELSMRGPSILARDAAVRAVQTPTCVPLGSRGGHPDIVAWRSGTDEFVYVEYKGPSDEIKPKQNAWAQALSAMQPSRVCYVAARGSFTGP